MTEPDGPDVVVDLALGAFRLVKEGIGFELDFAPETLPLVDHYLDGLRDGDAEPEETLVSVVAPCVGAYFGEVCRRTLAGLAWKGVGEDYAGWRLELGEGTLGFNPIGTALEAIHRQPVGDWHGHYAIAKPHREAVQRALEQAGPVREDDYYRLAVRHEVLEHALSVLERLDRAASLN